MVKKWFRCFLTLIACCVLSWNATALAAVMAHVDRFNISENETVNLTIEVTGDDSGDPQTAPLQKDFEILSNHHNSSFSIINGSTSSKSIYQLTLRPRHSGPLTIPPIKVGSVATTPIMIQISKVQARASAAGLPTGAVWLSMEISPKQLNVQQQAIITIHVYQAVGLNQAQLTEPTADHAIVERLGDDASYQKRANNRTWQVTERHYALFPQQSGQIDIAPVQLDGSALVGGASYFQTVRPIRVHSNGVKLDVSGIPDGWTGSDWLPAKQVRIEESWPDNTAFKVGEPITRTLTLRADGLTSSQLPEFSHDLPDHLKAYADKPELKNAKSADGVNGSRQEKVAIMPMQPGIYILPEVDIDWWNTTTQTQEQATLPARTFTVVAADITVPLPTLPKLSTNTEQKTEVEKSVVVAQPQAETAAAGWQWLAIFALAGWLLTLVWMWSARNGRGVQKDDVSHPDTANLKQLLKSVETACQNNHAKDCEQALLQIAWLQFPEFPIHSLAALAQIYNDTLKGEILKLEQSLYGSNACEWNGMDFLTVFRKSECIENRAHLPDNTSALPSLYPD